MAERRVVPRSEWGAPAAPPKALATYPMRTLYVHHSVTTPTARPFEDARTLERLGLGGSTSYTFSVHPSGTLMEGRPIEQIGAHTYGQNSVSLAVCVIGNYDELVHPTKESIDSIRWLRDAYLIPRGYLTPDCQTRGHRDAVATACPGRNLYAALDRIRQKWDGSPNDEMERHEVEKLFKELLAVQSDLIYLKQVVGPLSDTFHALGNGDWRKGAQNLATLVHEAASYSKVAASKPGSGGGATAVEIIHAMAERLAK